jgi:hypothetical protein
MTLPERKIVFRAHGIRISKYEMPDGTLTGWDVVFPHWPTPMQMSTNQAQTLRDALTGVLDEAKIGRPNGISSEIP